MRNLKGGRFGNSPDPNGGKTSGIWIFNEIDDYIEELKWPPQPESSLIQCFVFNESLKTNYDYYHLLYANNDNFNDYGDFSKGYL